MKKIFKTSIASCIMLMCVCMSSCTDDVIMEAENSKSLPPFKLYVNQEAPSRLALGEDGLSVVWEPGDQLVMVKKDKSGEPIYLDCDLEEMAYSATFTAGEGVPVGDYYVFYNYNGNSRSIDNIYSYTHQQLMPTEAINDEDRLALWGEVSVKEGDSSASIILKHIYAKVKISIKSHYTSEWKSFRIGMYASKGGFPSRLIFTENGMTNAVEHYGLYPSETHKVHNILLSGDFYPISDEGTFDNEKNYTALILPADLSEGSLYVYGICEDHSYGNDLICFETEKKNVKFEAGKSYKISLHLGYPNDENPNHKAIKMYTIEDEENWDTYYKLSTPDECRVAAYLNNDYGCKYQITNDIDFQGQTYLPFAAERIIGNGHTIKNITLDWSDADNVGLVRNFSNECLITDLTLENVSFSGHSFVGAFGGRKISTENCKVTGNSTITGTGDFVGGIVGYYEDTKGPITTTTVDASCTVKGNNCVGGIIGSGNLYSTMKSVTSSATVTAIGDYVGGIVGLLSSVDEELYYKNNEINPLGTYQASLLKCSNYGYVTGRNYVGGIIGYEKGSEGVIKQLINEGNIKGESYVGGIAGNFANDVLRIAYSTGNITATTNAGGIVGSMAESWYSNHSITDCYSLANISVSNGGYAGGIVGISGFNSSDDDYEYEETRKHSITNCYFAGTNSTGKGIVGYDLGNTFIKNCLTTLSSLGIESNVTNSFTGVTSILNKKSVINGNNAYSNETWPLDKYPKYCPKFIDFSGDVEIPGFGDSDIEI